MNLNVLRRFYINVFLFFAVLYWYLQVQQNHAMVFDKNEFDAIMADETKNIREDITWDIPKPTSKIAKFRVKVSSVNGYPIFIDGSYNRLLEKLSYSIIHRGIGKRIYGLDLGASPADGHVNPDGSIPGANHIHSWTDEFEDMVAFSSDKYIYSIVTNPIGVWKEFCELAKINFNGLIEEIPPLESIIDFDLGGVII